MSNRSLEANLHGGYAEMPVVGNVGRKNPVAKSGRQGNIPLREVCPQLQGRFAKYPVDEDALLRRINDLSCVAPRAVKQRNDFVTTQRNEMPEMLSPCAPALCLGLIPVQFAA